MTTFKAVAFKHHIKADKSVPIKIRVTHLRKIRYIDSGYVGGLSDFTRSMHLKTPAFIDATNDKIKEYRQKVSDDPFNCERMDADQLVSYLTKEASTETGLDFVQFAQEHILSLRAKKRDGTADDYQVALNSLVRYVGFKQIPVSSIKGKFLTGFVKWLEEAGYGRAPSKYLESLRALHNEMKKEYNDEEEGTILIPWSPFKFVEWPTRAVVPKRALSPQLIGKIWQLPDEPIKNSKGTNRYQIGKDCFILSFFLLGTNTADLYEACMTDGVLHYDRAKVRDRREDRGEMQIDVPEEIAPLIQAYIDPTGKRAFNFYLTYKNRKNFNKAVNKGLKKVGAKIGVPDLEYYAARHSLASIARNKVGINKDVVHEMLNHATEGKLKVTDLYLDKDWTVINKANRKVINWMKKALNGEGF